MSRPHATGLNLLALCAISLVGCRDADRPPAAVGTLERDRIELVAEAHEPILEILVTEGETVESGQLVMRLDNRRATALLAAVQARQTQADARLRELERGPRAESIQEARARHQGAISAATTAQLELERAKELAAHHFESQSAVDIKQALFDRAIADRDEARAALEAKLEGTTVEELDQARSATQAAAAEVEELSIHLDRLAVRSPRAGSIDALPYEVGDRPAAGAVVAVVLAGAAPYARVYVPAQVRTRLRPGAEAMVAIDGWKTPFRGITRFVSAEAAFTPYFALTEYDRGRLSYLAEIDLIDSQATDLPTGVPVEVQFEPQPSADRPER